MFSPAAARALCCTGLRSISRQKKGGSMVYDRVLSGRPLLIAKMAKKSLIIGERREEEQ